jgi:hypothetical protein
MLLNAISRDPDKFGDTPTRATLLILPPQKGMHGLLGRANDKSMIMCRIKHVLQILK